MARSRFVGDSARISFSSNFYVNFPIGKVGSFIDGFSKKNCGLTKQHAPELKRMVHEIGLQVELNARPPLAHTLWFLVRMILQNILIE